MLPHLGVQCLGLEAEVDQPCRISVVCRVSGDTPEVVEEERSEQVMTRMTPFEVQMLEQIAEADGLYRTDVIRVLVRREHARRFKKAKR